MMEAVRSSKKILVCQTCGDEGFKNAFIFCSKCLDFVIHRYCLKVMPKTFEERVNWCCESCKVKSLQSQKKEAENFGQIEVIHLMKRQEKLKNDACIKAGTNDVNCQDNITDPECEYIDIRKWLSPHHIPKKKLSNRKKIAACSTAKRKDDKLLCSLMEDSVKRCFNARKKIAACEHENFISDSSCMEIELDKTGNHECQDEIGTNVSLSADFENNLPDNCNRHAQPVSDPIWRGSFNILGKDYEKFGALVTYLSNKACTKLFKEALTLPSLLHLTMHPNSVLWPKSFGECDASDDNSALYFFLTPGDPINEKAFDRLVSKMVDKELAMRTTSKNEELLIFTSLVLNPLFQRYQKKYYLWGVFRSKQNNPTSEHPPLDVKRMPTRMKTLDVVSPRSPLSNNAMDLLEIIQLPNFGDDEPDESNAMKVDIRPLQVAASSNTCVGNTKVRLRASPCGTAAKNAVGDDVPKKTATFNNKVDPRTASKSGTVGSFGHGGGKVGGKRKLEEVIEVDASSSPVDAQKQGGRGKGKFPRVNEDDDDAASVSVSDDGDFGADRASFNDRSIPMDPKAANATFIPNFQHVKNDTTLDHTPTCRDFMETISTPAEMRRVARGSNSTVANTLYFYLCQLCVLVPEIRNRWSQEASCLEGVVNEMEGKMKQYEEFLGGSGGVDVLKEKVSALEVEVEGLKEELSKKEIEKQDLLSEFEAERARLGKEVEVLKAEKEERARLGKEVEVLKAEKESLQGERLWLVGEGFKWFLDKVRGSSEFKASMRVVKKQSFFAGYQQGLFVGEKYAKGGKPVSEAPQFDPEAKKKLGEAFREFLRKPYAFVEKISRYANRSLEELKSVMPDAGPAHSVEDTLMFSSP